MMLFLIDYVLFDNCDILFSIRERTVTFPPSIEMRKPFFMIM